MAEPFCFLTEYNVKENSVETTMDILNKEKVKQDDPRLIQIIKEHFIEPPSALPYRLKQKNMQDYSVYKISPMVDTHLDKMVCIHFLPNITLVFVKALSHYNVLAKVCRRI